MKQLTMAQPSIRRVPAHAGLDPRRALRRAFATDPILTLVGLAMLLALAGTLVGLLVDPRVITGAPAWLKPAKFAVSISIYSFTLVWLLGFVRGHPRLVRLAGGITGIGLAAEMVIIAGQVARGTTSHFNVGTRLDAALWSTMGFVIVAVWTMTLLVAILLLIQRLPDPAFAWGLRLGVLLALAGMAVAVLMTVPSPANQAAFAAGHAGAHSVGVADGGPGLPLVGWSTVGGDLRVPHFVGLHALQVMPLVGWLLTRWPAPRLRRSHRVALVWVAGLGYLGLLALLTWQALRGQSVVAPDAATLAALGALAGCATLAAAAVVAHASRARRLTGAPDQPAPEQAGRAPAASL